VPPWVKQLCGNGHELAGKPTTVSYTPLPMEQLKVFANCWGCNNGATSMVHLVGLTDCPQGKAFRAECAAAKGVVLAAAKKPRFDAALAAPDTVGLRAEMAAAVGEEEGEEDW